MSGRGMYEHTTFSTSDFYFLLVADNGNTQKISAPRKSKFKFVVSVSSASFRFFQLLIFQ